MTPMRRSDTVDNGGERAVRESRAARDLERGELVQEADVRDGLLAERGDFAEVERDEAQAALEQAHKGVAERAARHVQVLERGTRVREERPRRVRQLCAVVQHQLLQLATAALTEERRETAI